MDITELRQWQRKEKRPRLKRLVADLGPDREETNAMQVSF